MDFNHDSSWDNLLEVFNLKLSITDSWNKIINFHEKIIWKPYWNDLRQLEFVSEQNEIKEWLEHFVKNSDLPPSVLALWIGILKMEYNGKLSPTIYIVGSDTYIKNSNEWASQPIYVPDNRYAIPGILGQIDDIVKADNKNYEFFDWILPLAYCALTFDDIIRTKLDTNLFLKSRNKIHVVTGHDSGDYLELSCIK
mgnify:CR=1 FL=1